MSVLAHQRFSAATGTRLSAIAGVGALALVALLAALPFFASRGLIQDLFLVFSLLALAQYWNLLAGYAGLVSVGQQAFVGLGAYALFASTMLAGLDPVLSILIAGAVAAIVAWPVALVVFRLKNAYFAVGTWVVAEVFRLVVAQIKSLGGGTGTALPKSVTNDSALISLIAHVTGSRTPAARDMAAYWLALVVVVLTMALVYALLRSKRGLALSAIRDNEGAAGSVGVNLARTKLYVYVVCAFGAGLTGALIYLQKARISPDAAFSVTDWTAFVLFIVIIGGIATIEGPIVGVLIFWLLQDQLAAFGAWYLMILGALAVCVMLFFPEGVWGALAHRYDIHLFPFRRRLVVSGGKGAT